MSEVPEIDFAAISKELSTEAAENKFQALQWKNLANSLQAKVENLETALGTVTAERDKYKESMRKQAFPDQEIPVEGEVVPDEAP